MIGPPVVGLFDLRSVTDLLPEETVFVIDAVAEAGKIERCERVEKACGQAAEAAVAQRRVRLGLFDLAEVEPQFPDDSTAFVEQAEVRQVVAQRSADQEFE
jgi:hypothetical protein